MTYGLNFKEDSAHPLVKSLSGLVSQILKNMQLLYDRLLQIIERNKLMWDQVRDHEATQLHRYKSVSC